MDSLDKVTVSELKKICQEESISNYNKLKKKELINLIRLHRIDNIINDGLKKLNEIN